MFTAILFAVLISLFVALTIFSFAMKIRIEKRNSYSEWHVPGILCIIATVFCLAIFIGVSCDQYNERIRLPFSINALSITISEQTSLLSGGSGFADGLEGMQMKQSIQGAIRDKNDLIARARYINANPWFLFKVDGY